MQRLLHISLLVIISALALPGCAYLKGKKAIIKSQDMAYVHTKARPPLQVPRDLVAVELNDDLMVPTAAPWNGKPPSLLPPNSLAEQIASGKVNPAVLKTSLQRTPAVTINHPSEVEPLAVSADQLLLKQNFAQSWSSIGNVIAPAGYKTLNENKSLGRYYFADLPSTGGKLVRETEIYQLHLNQQGSQTVVSLTDNAEQLVAPVIAKRILLDIQKALQAKPTSWWPHW